VTSRWRAAFFGRQKTRRASFSFLAGSNLALRNRKEVLS
jgi:hypothetical protein